MFRRKRKAEEWKEEELQVAKRNEEANASDTTETNSVQSGSLEENSWTSTESTSNAVLELVRALSRVGSGNGNTKIMKNEMVPSFDPECE